MTVYVWALLFGAVITAAINYNNRVVLRWLTIGAANFALTYLYYFHALSWLPHAFVTGVADAAFVIAIMMYRRQAWEKAVQYCFMLSVLVSMSKLLGWLPDQTSYGIALEVTNWAALLVMGGTGILRLIDEDDTGDVVGQVAWSRPRRALHRARMAIESPRRSEGVLARAGR